MPEPRSLGVVAAIGTLTFAVIVVTLTVVDWSFLRARGWDPVRSNDVPYPSTLALGSTGSLQVLNFAILAVALLAAAGGLWQALDPRPSHSIALIAVAGVAALALMAPTDGSLSSVRSWHGALHTGAFLVLLVAIVLGALLLGLALAAVPGWEGAARLSIVAAVVIVVLTGASFVLPRIGSLASIASIAAMLAWLEVVAIHLAAIR